MIINFTGQPESGKSTLAQLLKNEIKWYYPSHKVVILDGDVIREVTNNKDYSPAGRIKNITGAYNIAKGLLMASKIDTEFKVIVILAIISPYKNLRKELKKSTDVLEYYLTSNRNSRAQFNVKDYEPPTKNFTHFITDNSAESLVRIIVSDIKKQNNFRL